MKAKRGPTVRERARDYIATFFPDDDGVGFAALLRMLRTHARDTLARAKPINPGVHMKAAMRDQIVFVPLKVDKCLHCLDCFAGGGRCSHCGGDEDFTADCDRDCFAPGYICEHRGDQGKPKDEP